jgi:energy-coupling factor transport system permease protein
VGAWLLWLVAAMLGALGTRNPFYLVLITISALLVNAQLGRSAEKHTSAQDADQAGYDPSRRGFYILLRAVIVLMLIVALLKGLSIHIGTTVLFTLPEGWPVIGGPITLEGMAYAGLDAFSLVAVLSVFVAFSAGADYYALLRSVPPFMHQVGLVTSIAITFMPQTVIRFTEIREAQALRGHKVRGIRDLVPLIVPLLAGGMERSMNLAEAMESRGFSRSPAGARKVRPIYVQLGMVSGLGLVLAGGAMFAFFAAMPWIGWGCIVVGVSLVGATLWLVGKGSKRSRYRRSIWRDRDTALAVASAAVGLILLTHKLLAPATLVYDPLSRVRIYAPPFDVVLACVMLGLVAPALIARGFAAKAPRTVAEVEGYAR